MVIARKLHKSKGERGATLVEAALVLPVFLLILFGIIGFGVDLGLQQSVTHAASEAARGAISAPSLNPGEAACTAWKNEVTASIASSLSWLPSTVPQPTYWSGTGTAPSSYFKINFLDSSFNATQCTNSPPTASGTTYVQVVLHVPTILPNFGIAPSAVQSQAQVQVQ
jgi:Flp pilus assembly protein TadG